MSNASRKICMVPSLLFLNAVSSALEALRLHYWAGLQKCPIWNCREEIRGLYDNISRGRWELYPNLSRIWDKLAHPNLINANWSFSILVLFHNRSTSPNGSWMLHFQSFNFLDGGWLASALERFAKAEFVEYSYMLMPNSNQLCKCNKYGQSKRNYQWKHLRNNNSPTSK